MYINKASFNTTINTLLVLFVACLFNTAIANTKLVVAEKKLNFRVFLDSREIGYHRVNIRPTIDGEQVSVEAKFDVEIFFINIFSYLHTAQESWKNECLESIETQTTENGEHMFILSDSSLEGLIITSHQAETTLLGCIRSFAYWDPQRLDSKRLLNTQTGEHVPARLSDLGDVVYKHDGKNIAARQYLLEAEDAEINLWYSLDKEWLALKTKVKGGRVLAYYRILDSTDE